VGGDVEGEAGARLLAEAADRWRARGGGEVWTYTHRWREVPVGGVGAIAVLASCEDAAQVLEARQLGYAAALVVGRHVSQRRVKSVRGGLCHVGGDEGGDVRNLQAVA